jgi:REP element-mobilizing transposase RayT
MECVLGKIQNSKVKLSPIGEVVYRCWKEIPNHFNMVKLDVFTVMPNHFHAILFLEVGARFIVPKIKEKSGFDKSNPYIKNNPMALNQPTLGKIIRSFKAKTAHQIRKYIKFNHFQWQRNYYEHVIRNEEELNLIRRYILYNTLQWQYDRENPEHVQDKGYQDEWGDFERKIFGEDIMQQARMPVVTH